MGGTNIHTTNSAHRPFMLHLLLMALLPWDAHFTTSPHMTALHAVALDPLINRLLTTHRLCASCLSAHRCLPYATTATATTTAARDRSVPLRIERCESWVGYGLEYSCIIGLRWTDRSEGTLEATQAWFIDGLRTWGMKGSMVARFCPTWKPPRAPNKHWSSQKQKPNKPVLFGFWLKMSIPRSKQGEDEEYVEEKLEHSRNLYKIISFKKRNSRSARKSARLSLRSASWCGSMNRRPCSTTSPPWGQNKRPMYYQWGIEDRCCISKDGRH